MTRDIYNYTYRVGRKVSHRGITNDPARREREHQRARPGGKLTVEGRAKTRAGARRAERGRSGGRARLGGTMPDAAYVVMRP